VKVIELIDKLLEFPMFSEVRLQDYIEGYGLYCGKIDYVSVTDDCEPLIFIEDRYKEKRGMGIEPLPQNNNKCECCTFYGLPSDAPKTLDKFCMWEPSEENGWDIPCEPYPPII
jgi:hypothetical protein